MDNFLDTRNHIGKRYKHFLPTFCFLHSKDGLQMMVRLTKVKIELLINVSETYADIKIKIDALIVCYKNRLNSNFCECGVGLFTYSEYIKCKVCGLESCIGCHFINFKINSGSLVCPKCHHIVGKKIKKLSTFQEIFNKTLTDYVERTGELSLLELVGTI